MTAHVDVGAYALGVLDEQGARDFEEHLAGCDACAVELERLLPVVALLPPAVAVAPAPAAAGTPAAGAAEVAAPVRAAARPRTRFARREHRTCSMVAVRGSGDREVLSSWTVPEGGYGTTERPQSLALETSTALAASEMSTLEVEAVGPDDQTRTLLTLVG